MNVSEVDLIKEVPRRTRVLADLLGAVEHPPFDALVGAGMAGDLVEAVDVVAASYPPPGSSSWNDLASWVEDYEDQARRPTPQPRLDRAA